MKKHSEIFAHTDCISEEMMTKYISGKLSPAEKHEVEKHLVDCEMCSDAVEGLSMVSGKKISSITSELNQKIQNRLEKKEVKVVFLRQYRTQLAVAASIVLVVGLVWFFKTNVSMKEMDNAEANKMFAEKFVPPPSEKDEEVSDSMSSAKGKEQTENPVSAPDEPAFSKHAIVSEEAEKKATDKESPSYSAAAEVKTGKDIDEKHLAENIKQEDVPVQKADQLRKGIAPKKAEEKGTENFYTRNEIPKANVSTDAKLKTREADNDAVQDEFSKVTATKEEVQKNMNELESLKKENDTKWDESKKSQAVTTSNTEVTTIPQSAAGASSVSSNTPAQDKSADDRERPDANTVSRGQNGEGAVLTYETQQTKGEKSGGKFKRSKEKAPQKNSGGYYDMQSSTSAPIPETKATETQTMAGEDLNGKQVKADTVMVSSGFATFGSTMNTADATLSLDGAMEKYDKKDYAGALVDFENTLKQNPNDEKALFYSAVSYLSLGQTDKALVNFNKILANKNSKYYEDAQWYSSLAYIKNNDMKNARSNLIQIQNNEKSRYKKQADETLEQIKK